MRRDARPFVAHHLRECADERADTNGPQLHVLARWVENLPADNEAMGRIASTEALDYPLGAFVCGETSTALIDRYHDSESKRATWLASFADAVEHDLRER
jgi:hypothetical protein